MTYGAMEYQTETTRKSVCYIKAMKGWETSNFCQKVIEVSSVDREMSLESKIPVFKPGLHTFYRFSSRN